MAPQQHPRSAADLRRELAEAFGLVPDLLHDFQWFASLGGERTGRNSERVHTSTTPDHTQNIAAGSRYHRNVRAKVRETSRRISDACSMLWAARNLLTEIEQLIEENNAPEVGMVDPNCTISQDELREAREAQARRTARGQGWGQG